MSLWRLLARPGWLVLLGTSLGAQPAASVVPVGVEPLAWPDDRARQVNDGWHRYLEREIADALQQRRARQSPNALSAEAHERFLTSRRDRLRRLIGAVEEREADRSLQLELSGDTDGGPWLRRRGCTVWSARWPAFAQVHGEGLLLLPAGDPRALVVLTPDADQWPEDLAGLTSRPSPGWGLAWRLVEQGAVVVIPTLANRGSRFCGDEGLGIFTNQSQREWIYRQAAPVGRHITGYETLKVLAAIDCLTARFPRQSSVGVIGHGEGGWLALCAAALDSRIKVSWISGYFGPHLEPWKEPIYRSGWNAAREFDDAEIASLVAPRALVIDLTRGPIVTGDGSVARGPVYARSAAPGELFDPTPEAVKSEWTRARSLVGGEERRRFFLVEAGDGQRGEFGRGPALDRFWQELVGQSSPSRAGLAPQRDEEWARACAQSTNAARIESRERRTLRELQSHTQGKLREAASVRAERFGEVLQPRSAVSRSAQVSAAREALTNETLGRLQLPEWGDHARVAWAPEWSTAKRNVYHVVLEVVPGAWTWGCLLLPTQLAPGERRPVVVCQHGSGGVPMDTFDEDPSARAHRIYQAYAARLVEQGFVVFAPYLPNRIGGDDYRLIQRKAQLVGLSLFAIVTASHERVLHWLRTQPYVDAERLGLYGMSYGAKAAIRAAATLEDYRVVICSGDFNDNVAAITTTRYDRNECMFYPDYDLVEVHAAHGFNYAELGALIAPRWLMIEFGYDDRAVQLEGAAAEYAQVERLYARLGVPERVGIEFFAGGHTVHGKRAFEFLHRGLAWP